MAEILGFPSGDDGKKAPQIYAWHLSVQRDDRGRILENIPNAKKILSTDPRWIGIFRWNEMHRRIFVHGESPTEVKGGKIVPRPIQDYDISRCQSWLQEHGAMFMVGKETVYSAIREISAERAYHPIKEAVEAVTWDGVPRLDTMLVKYFGVADTPYSRKVSRLFMIGMVQRVWFPGSKMDYMLVLEGPQGLGKSTAAMTLAGEEYFGEAHFKELDSVDTSIFLKNKWVVEFGEMHTLRKNEVNELKMWLTKKSEDYRPKYGRENVNEPRQCVFIGTCNNSEYLRDATGARRFWPVYCKQIDLPGLIEARSQILAEALAALRAGENCYPEREFESEFFVEEQAKRSSIDPWSEFIRPLTEAHEKLSLDLICQRLRLERSKLDMASHGRIKDVMTQLGWEYYRSNAGRYWRKVPEKSAVDIALEQKL